MFRLCGTVDEQGTVFVFASKDGLDKEKATYILVDFSGSRTHVHHFHDRLAGGRACVASP